MADMTLRQKQSAFAKALGKLLVYAYTIPGVELTMGEGHVDNNISHMKGSLHEKRLAQDINLFVDGEWIEVGHPVWIQLGSFWKGHHHLARWGGDFMAPDGNHFSFEHEGVR